MSAAKPKQKMAWLKSPLIYVPLIGISVYLIFFRPHSNNIVRGNDATMYCATTDDPQTKLTLICWDSDGILAEDSVGNRFVIEKEKIATDYSIVLKKFNTDYAYYVKMNSPQTLFQGMTLDQVVRKAGDYVYGDVAQGIYTFPYVIAVQGSTRHHGVTIRIGEDGKVASVQLGEKSSSNWFGALPYYADIVSLNMYTPSSQPILKDVAEPEQSRGVFMWLLIAAWNLVKLLLVIVLYFFFIAVVFAIPLSILFPVLSLLTLVKAVPNWLIMAVVWGLGLAIVYVMTIAQIEGTRAIWLLTLPISVVTGLLVIALFNGLVDRDRCPKCRRNGAISRTQKAISQHTLTEEKDHHIKGGKSYVGRKGNRDVYNRELNCWTTEQKIVTTEYRVTLTCSHCGYVDQFTTNEVKRGPLEVIDRWKDSQVVTQRVDPEPYKSINSDMIEDEYGNVFDRAIDGKIDSGSTVVNHNGEKYVKR